MTGSLSKNFHGVGIGPLSKILAVKSFGRLQTKLDITKVATTLQYERLIETNKQPIGDTIQNYVHKSVQLKIYSDYGLQLMF